MTIREGRAALGEFEVGANAIGSGCAYATSARLPRGVSVMVVDGVVVRVDADSNTVSTAEGARVGDTERRVLALYGARVKVSPHEYTDGHYLTVRPVTGDTSYLIIFETDKDTVNNFRAGKVPQVQWVEGCS
jgi:hypothetical protein